MRHFYFVSIFLISFSIISCSDNGTGTEEPEEPTTYSINVAISPSNSGTISPDTENTVEEGEEIELQANPNDGYLFSGWTGDIENSNNPLSITASEDLELTANFELKSYELSINTEGEGTVNEEVIQQKSTDYEHGTLVELTANPAEGYKFVEWQGDLTVSDNPAQITIDEPKNVTAVFEQFSESPFESGDGSKEYPYEVSTIEQLQEIQDYTASHFIQINDIDATETVDWNDGVGFVPIGNEFVKFTGDFDGQNFVIKQLTIDQANDFVGLFGQVEDGIIKNVTIINSNVSGNNYTGILTGRNNGEVINSFAEGNVNGSYYSGGLVGHNLGLIKNSGADVNVNGAWVIGGLVGNNQNVIDLSYSSGNVVANGRVGGLTGWNSGNINESFAEGNVTSTSPFGHAGGLIGQNRASVMKSFSLGDVEGKEVIGGLVGLNEFSSSIEASYAHGNVTGEDKIGGLIGINGDNANAIESFSTGKVVGNVDKGGLVGINGASIESCYWDSDSSEMNVGVGQGLSDSVTSSTTSQMTGVAAKNNMTDFDWENIWKTTSDYPILRWQDE